MQVGDSVVSEDGFLKVTLSTYNSGTGAGRIKIEELAEVEARFYVTVYYGEGGGQTRIDYKTFDVYKSSEFSFSTNRGDAISEITILSIPTT